MPNAAQPDVLRLGIALVAIMGLWLLVQEIGAEYGWPLKYAFLVDLAAGAAFLWTMIVTWTLWRKRRA